MKDVLGDKSLGCGFWLYRHTLCDSLDCGICFLGALIGRWNKPEGSPR
jgi:hypothetical protein